MSASHTESILTMGGSKINARPGSEVNACARQGQLLAKAHARTDQRIHLATGLQQVKPSHGHQSPLADLAALAMVMNNLNIAVGPAGFCLKNIASLQ